MTGAAVLSSTTADTAPRHSVLVRVTHWVTVLCFLALLVSGVELIISHPRFYWGEAGNARMVPLLVIPIPASRDTVPTGYGYVLPDQNGWSRSLHFQTAWLLVATGLLYGLSGLFSGHFLLDLWPRGFSWRMLREEIFNHLRFKRPDGASYNILQRLSYLGVIFLLFPTMIWTGLAMSPGVTSALPWVVTFWGGQQSARTIHFFVTLAIVLFVVAHVAMVILAGFKSRVRAMIFEENV